MNGVRYAAARAAAPRVAEHFAKYIAVARRDVNRTIAFAPDVPTIETIIDAAFWASLRREEGYTPTISLAYLPAEQAGRPVLFERAISLQPESLAKVAPAVERAGIHLGVWDRQGELCVWGTTRTLPVSCFVLEVNSPGLLVVKHHRGEESGKYVNVAVLEGDHLKMIDERASSLPDCPPLLSSLLGFDAPASWAQSLNVLVQLAASMRSHKRGGALLVVPSGSEDWRQSIVQPIVYAIRPFFSELAELMTHPATEHRRWQEALSRAVDIIAGLTVVDGGTIITVRYELLAFGAKIARRDGCPLVASQDGHFTVFAWSPCESMVHAHRVESLLL